MRHTATTAAAVLTTAALAVGGGLTGALTGAASAAAAPVPVHLAPGTTSRTLTGHLGAGGALDLLVDARAGQSAQVELDGGPTTRWTLVAPDGSPLHSQMSEARSATTTLPVTGTYRLDVLTTDPSDWSLTLTLPVRIRFAPGATSAAVTGDLPRGARRDYTFDARAGQTARVGFSRGASTTRWVLVDPTGSPLHSQGAQQQDGVSVRLPSTGTYRLQVLTTDADRYRLLLAIPAR